MPHSATILMVDDNVANRDTLRELLEPENYELVEAADGPTALRLAAKVAPDLVLLDVMMPGMDGYEVCRRLRSNPRLAEVPVVMVTALADPASRLAGIEAGADDFVTKPFNRAELRARTRTITRLNRYRLLHEAQVALRESEQWPRTLFEQAAVGVVHMDAATGRYLRVNQRFCGLVGRTSEELLRLTFADITHPDDRGSNLENVRRLREGSIREFTQEKRYVRKDGSSVWASLAASSIGAPGEAPASFVGFVQDITERKQLDEHLLQTQKMEALGQFSGGVAHDFNNILAAISGFTEIARLQAGGNEEVREHLRSVLQATGRAADLVRQILTFSRQQPQERLLIQLQPVVLESLKLLRATIPATIEFETTIAPEAVTVLANATQVHQVLMNLGVNAWHAMKDHTGRLQVKLEVYAVDAAYAATKPRLRPGEYVRISVSDTGCGMDPATIRRIFEPFFTTKPLGEGTGLGLSVVHGIMDVHDGAITVHSHPGEGTVFRLYFPVVAGASVQLAADEGPTPRGAGQRILVVDDEELLAELHHKALALLGYEVETVTRPSEALAAVRADPGRFALVLTDQTMPGMTGLDLARELRQIQPELPIILMTGYSLSLTAERVEAAGIRQILLKPGSLFSVGAAVHAALAGSPRGEISPGGAVPFEHQIPLYFEAAVPPGSAERPAG